MNNIFIYTRICTICKKEKGLAEFVINRGKSTSRCYECNNMLAKERYRKSVLCTNNKSPWYKITRMKIKIPIEGRGDYYEF